MPLKETVPLSMCHEVTGECVPSLPTPYYMAGYSISVKLPQRRPPYVSTASSPNQPGQALPLHVLTGS